MMGDLSFVEFWAMLGFPSRCALALSGLSFLSGLVVSCVQFRHKESDWTGPLVLLLLHTLLAIVVLCGFMFASSMQGMGVDSNHDRVWGMCHGAVDATGVLFFGLLLVWVQFVWTSVAVVLKKRR
jgi:hypothetical protein